MVSSMGGDMLLDRNLGNMVHLVVNLNTNLVDNRSGSNSNWSSMSNSNWGSMSNSNWGCMSNSNRGGSMNSSNRSSMDSSSKRSSMSYSKRSSSNCRCRGIDSTKEATSDYLSIGISSRGSKATGNNSRENSEEFHIDCVEIVPTIPM